MKQLFVLLIISLLSTTCIKAQDIYINLSSGTSVVYGLSTIDRILFQNNSMTITLHGGSVSSYPIDSIKSYNYPQTMTGVTALSKMQVQQLKIYPNPSSGQVAVDYELDRDSRVEIIVYNVSGTQMFSQNKEQAAGEYHETLHLDSPQFISGIYFIELRTSKERFINKLILN
jgi:hypothetical protein